jgi:hypothetical protein
MIVITTHDQTVRARRHFVFCFVGLSRSRDPQEATVGLVWDFGPWTLDPGTRHFGAPFLFFCERDFFRFETSGEDFLPFGETDTAENVQMINRNQSSGHNLQLTMVMDTSCDSATNSILLR